MQSRLKNAGEKLAGGAVKAASWYSHADTAMNLASMFMRGEPTQEMVEASGVMGMLGFKDERELDSRLLRMEREHPGEELPDGVLEYRRWARLKITNESVWTERLVAWYYDNKWRTYVLGLPKSAAQVRKEKTKTTNHKRNGDRIVTERERDVKVGGVDEPYEWLLNLAKKVKAAPEDKRKRHAVFRKIKLNHQTVGVPYAPKGRQEIAREAERIIREATGSMPHVVKSVINATSRGSQYAVRAASEVGQFAVNQTPKVAAQAVIAIDNTYAEVQRRKEREPFFVKLARKL